jgi:hypothetical protein
VISFRALVFQTATVSSPHDGGTLANAAASRLSATLTRSTTPRLNASRPGA